MTKDDSIQTPRVALLIDADNVGDKQAEFIFARAAAYGNVVVRKAYGVFGVGAFRWKKQSIFKYAIEPVARYAYVSRKNSTDIVLVIDAMDLAHRKIADVFCIVSNDSDFTPLAMKLREFGVKVVGFGNSWVSKSFGASCDEFHVLPAEESAKNSKPDSAAGDNTESNSDEQESSRDDAESDSGEQESSSFSVRENIFAALEAYGDENGWANLSVVGNYLRRIDPSFSLKNHGFSKLVDLAESVGEFEIERNLGKTRIKRKD